MRLYWLAGDPGAALAQYKRCQQILRDELGVEPMAATTRLYAQMAQNQYAPGAAGRATNPARAAAAPPAPTEPLLQKIRELQTALEHNRAELQSLENMVRTSLFSLGPS
jgi:DNA-binding SARP family transcriptional activator